MAYAAVGGYTSSVSTEHGFRVFTMTNKKKTFLDVRPEAPPLLLVFRLTPTISENIITALEIDIHPLSAGSDFLEDLAKAADALAAYLHHSTIHMDSPGEYSGSERGLFVRLTGSSYRPVIARFVESFVTVLSDVSERWNVGEEGTPHDFPYQGLLPVSTYIVDYVDKSTDEARADGRRASATLAAKDHFSAVMRAMDEAPAILANYLQRHGFGELAEFAKHKSVATRTEWPAWLAFVRGVEKRAPFLWRPPSLCATTSSTAPPPLSDRFLKTTKRVQNMILLTTSRQHGSWAMMRWLLSTKKSG